jgi:hypothetical protein
MKTQISSSSFFEKKKITYQIRQPLFGLLYHPWTMEEECTFEFHKKKKSKRASFSDQLSNYEITRENSATWNLLHVISTGTFIMQ